MARQIGSVRRGFYKLPDDTGARRRRRRRCSSRPALLQGARRHVAAPPQNAIAQGRPAGRTATCCSCPLPISCIARGSPARRIFSERRSRVPLFTAGHLYAAPAQSPRLLVVFLRGAYDAANIIVPAVERVLLCLAPQPRHRQGPAVPAAGFRLEPASGPEGLIYPLWQQKEIAFVPFTGTDDLPLAFRDAGHDRDGPAAGRPAITNRDSWPHRQALNGDTPISFTSQLPPASGAASRCPMWRSTHRQARRHRRNADLIQAMYQGQALAPAVSEGFAVATTSIRDLRRDAWPPTAMPSDPRL